MTLEVPASRRDGLARIAARLTPGLRVVLATHVNADGDGAGSETALAGWLRRCGLQPTIVNPTPFPAVFDFLRDGVGAWTPSDEEGRRALVEADFFLVLDTAEPGRLGAVAPYFASREVLTIDHHPPVTPPLGELSVRDPSACATGEMVFDLLAVAGEAPTLREAEGLYVAIVTDTGSFRFANTSPRAHEIVARLLRVGVDPETMYRRLFATSTPESLALLRRALGTLRVHPELPVASIRVSAEDLAETGTSRDDVEGIVEYARRLRGVEIAVLLRALPDGRTKVSLRAAGEADVAAVARALGGGGHTKAAGALVGADLDTAEEAVLEAIRSAR
ncbi:MAG: bifunctional oligoribonuclease/PAP phosphatase NrnA [Gemmatimonadota bacterium]|nr:bifunctional oligoribonuclease/PAP phosphatase NrnA [Gemmatimonadota bacterium]